MARLSNTPQQTLSLELERRKSYSFQCNMVNGDNTPVDLTGCTVRFVMKRTEHDDDAYDISNLIVNSAATIAAPKTGQAVFSFQAAELDSDPGDYYYSIVLWTADNYATTLLKGSMTLLANTESASIHRTYSTNTTSAILELTLRDGDHVTVVANNLTTAGWRTDIIGVGNPNNPLTLEAETLAQVTSASVGQLFISTDGGGNNEWAWRLRANGTWALVEGLKWEDIGDRPATPTQHTHPVTEIETANQPSDTTYLRGDGLWVEPPGTGGGTPANIVIDPVSISGLPEGTLVGYT